jgi:hypothetical protein
MIDPSGGEPPWAVDANHSRAPYRFGFRRHFVIRWSGHVRRSPMDGESDFPFPK